MSPSTGLLSSVPKPYAPHYPLTALLPAYTTQALLSRVTRQMTVD